MSAWIWITIAAATAQTLRFILQKQLAGAGLSAAGATYARFIYSAPLVAAGLAVLVSSTDRSLPAPDAAFWAYALTGGLAQILATIAIVQLFSMRNFAVGITLKKTEVLQTALIGFLLLGDLVLQTALIGFLLLGDLVSPLGLGGIVIGFLGVMFLTDVSGMDRARFQLRLDRSALLGLGSGALFGISGVCYRGASLSLDSGDIALRAGLTLACVTAAQTIAMTLWFLIRDGDQIRRVILAWRRAALVGITSMVGSFCWFSAFTLQQAAYVNAVGQIELAFSILASMLIFSERISAREWIGIALILSSIVTIILAI